MSDHPRADVSSAPSGLTRRRVVQGAAWSAPLILGASTAANASVLSNEPFVTTTQVAGTVRNGSFMDSTMTFTNRGRDATSLRVTVAITPTAGVGGSVSGPITDVQREWTAAQPTMDGGTLRVVFTRTSGIAPGAGSEQTLVFRSVVAGAASPLASAPNGTITVEKVETTPESMSNQGGSGAYA